MVRLKVGDVFRFHIPERFQFHYGSIKGLMKTKTFYIHFLDFNSTMVRLKARRTFVVSALYLFQFHYGSIKGVCEVVGFDYY